MDKGPQTRFPPMDENERLPRELLAGQPWYARLQGKSVYLGFLWLVAYAMVLAGSWWLSRNIWVVAIAVGVLGAAFWWLTRSPKFESGR